MALAAANRISTSASTVNAVTSGSFTPTALSLLVVSLEAEWDGTAGAGTISDTLGGLTWTQIVNTNDFDFAKFGGWWAVTPSSPTAGTVTVTFPAAAGTRRLGLVVDEVTGCDSASPVIQTVVNTTAFAATIPLAFTNPCAATSLVYTSETQESSTAPTVPTGFTLLVNGSNGNITGGVNTAYKNGSASQSNSWTGAQTNQTVAFALEVRLLAGPASPPPARNRIRPRRWQRAKRRIFPVPLETPQTIADLGLWLVADDLASGSVSGTAITAWRDRVGGVLFNDNGAGAAPSFVAAGPNGHAAVAFVQGTVLRQQTTPPDLLRAKPGFTIVAYGSATSPGSTSDQAVLFISSGASTTAARAGLRVGVTSIGDVKIVGRRLDADTSGTVNASSLLFPSSGYHWLAAVTDYTAATTHGWLDNVDGGSNAFQTAGSSDTTASLMTSVGSDGGVTTDGWIGNLVEVLLFQRALTTTEMNALDAYFTAKYVAAGTASITLTETATGADALTVTVAGPLTDTATGADALSLTAATPLADAGAGVDALALAAAVPLPELGAGADTISLTATAPLADTATAADTIASLSKGLPAETGTAVDALTVTVPVALTDAGSGVDALTVTVPVPLADVGAGADALAAAAAVPLTDVAAGSDAVALTAAVPLADTAAAVDAVTVQQGNNPALPDTGTAADALTATAALAVADTGTAADALVVTAPVPLADTVHGTDTLSSAAAVPLADTAAGADSVAATAAVPLADTSSATDAMSVAQGSNPALPDTGSAADSLTATAALSLPDTATGTDAVTLTAAVPLADPRTAADALAVTVAPSLADVAAATDSLTVAISVPLADTVHGTDTLSANAVLVLAEAAAIVDAIAAQLPTVGFDLIGAVVVSSPWSATAASSTWGSDPADPSFAGATPASSPWSADALEPPWSSTPS